MNKRKPMSNGTANANVLNEEQHEMRLKVVDAELKARYWKAQWEIRHYTLEAEALQGKYDEYVAAQLESQRKAFEAYLEQMKKENEVKVPGGEIDEITNSLKEGVQIELGEEASAALNEGAELSIVKE